MEYGVSKKFKIFKIILAYEHYRSGDRAFSSKN